MKQIIIGELTDDFNPETIRRVFLAFLKCLQEKKFCVNMFRTICCKRLCLKIYLKNKINNIILIVTRLPRNYHLIMFVL